MTFCRASGKPVSYSKSDITATSRYNGKPRKALVNCRRCHRPGLEATIPYPQIGLLDGEDGFAIMPHHYPREETR